MRLYIACPWKHKGAAVMTAALLREKGYSIVSSWHDRPSDDVSGHDSPPDVCLQEANDDLLDIGTADLMLVLNVEKSEGKAVEQGYALARRIPIMVVGERSNVFHYLPQIVVVSSIHEAIRRLTALTLSASQVESAR